MKERALCQVSVFEDLTRKPVPEASVRVLMNIQKDVMLQIIEYATPIRLPPSKYHLLSTEPR